MKIFKRRWFWTLLICLLLIVGLWFAIPNINTRIMAICAVIILWCVINLDLKVAFTRSKKTDNTPVADKTTADESVAIVHDDIFAHGFMLEKRYQTTQLPAYLIIGSEGCGKTSLLAQAGLRYPLPEQAPSIHRPHDDVQWWFSQQAILIENNRALNQEIDWRTHLNQIKAYHSQRQLNGIMLCLSAAELLNTPVDAAHDNAVRLRHFLVEINKQLNLSIPIYLVITQCDRIFGFTEFFADLSAQQRQNIFGVSLTYSAFENNPTRHMSHELQQLFAPLADQVLTKCHHNSEQNRALFTLPDQLRQVSKWLGDFTTKLVEHDGYHQTIPLRGVYLTCAMKSGEAIYPQLLSQTSGLPNQTIATDRRPESTSLFIPGLIQQMIKESQKLTRPSIKIQAQRQLRQYCYLGACSAVLLSAAFLWNHSYQLNVAKLNRIDGDLNQYQQLFTQRTNLIGQLQLISELSQAVNVRQHPWHMGLGLYVGKRLQPPIDDAYNMINEFYFNPFMQSLIEQSLQVSQDEALYHSLMVYLMLGNPDYFSATSVQDWLRNNPLASYQALIKNYPQLQPLLIQYYNQFRKPIQLNQTLVLQTREKLTQSSPAERIYWSLQNQMKNQPDVNLAANDLDEFKQVFTLPAKGFTIPELYTLIGLNEWYPKLSSEDITAAIKTNWVLNDNLHTATLSPEPVAQALHTLYLNDYVNYWQNLLNRLHITQFNSLDQAVKIVTILAKANAPTHQVLVALNQNTTIKTTPIGKTKKTLPLTPLQAQAQKTFDDNFASLNALLARQGSAAPAYNQIQTTLQALAATLTNIQQASNPKQAAFEVAKKRFEQSKDDALTQLFQLAISQPQPVKAWLEQIAQNSWQVILNLSSQYVDSVWQQQLAPLYDRSIANRYPLVKTAQATITLSDFSAFFAPNGKLASFTKAYLQPFYQTQENVWQAKTLNNQSLQLPPALITLLQRAQQLQQSFFANGNKSLQLSFSLKPLNLDATAASFTLTINGKTLTYAHGPERFTEFVWPDQASNQITIHFVDLNGQQFSKRFDGPWSLFRWLAASDIVAEPDGSHYQLQVKLDGHSAVLMLHADSVNNPFNFKTVG